jgi:hypothetical protein
MWQEPGYFSSAAGRFHARRLSPVRAPTDSHVKVIAISLLATLLAACGQGGSAGGKSLALLNPGFEEPAADGDIPGWNIVQHAGVGDYDVRVEPTGAFAGRGSLRISRLHMQAYGSLSQRIAVDGLVGRTVELSAMLKSLDVGARGWKLFANGEVPKALAYSPGLTGTSEWQRQSVRLKVTANMRNLTVGVTLLDGGTGWMDEVQLRAIEL